MLKTAWLKYVLRGQLLFFFLTSHFLNNNFLSFFLFLAMLGLLLMPRLFSSCSEQGIAAVLEFLIVVASLVADRVL